MGSQRFGHDWVTLTSLTSLWVSWQPDVVAEGLEDSQCPLSRDQHQVGNDIVLKGQNTSLPDTGGQATSVRKGGSGGLGACPLSASTEGNQISRVSVSRPHSAMQCPAFYLGNAERLGIQVTWGFCNWHGGMLCLISSPVSPTGTGEFAGCHGRAVAVILWLELRGKAGVLVSFLPGTLQWLHSPALIPGIPSMTVQGSSCSGSSALAALGPSPQSSAGSRMVRPPQVTVPRAQVVTQGWLGELKAHSEYRKQLSPQTQGKNGRGWCHQKPGSQDEGQKRPAHLSSMSLPCHPLSHLSVVWFISWDSYFKDWFCF